MRERLLAAERVKAIEWRDGTLRLLDQRLLPQEEVWLEHESAAEVAKAIRDMVVRGAPAIGISAAYGIVLGAPARAWRRAATGAPRWRRTSACWPTRDPRRSTCSGR